MFISKPQKLAILANKNIQIFGENISNYIYFAPIILKEQTFEKYVLKCIRDDSEIFECSFDAYDVGITRSRMCGMQSVYTLHPRICHIRTR